jgi:hypothetical protein
VRDMVTQSLRGWGYEALVAGIGEEGLALGIAHSEMAQAFGNSHAETRILHTSGHGEDIIAHGGSLEAGIEFLSKPYTMDPGSPGARDLGPRLSL